MSKLELKIPPVLLVVIFAVLMALISKTFPGIPAPREIRGAVFAALTLLGASCALAGVAYFRKAETTVNPVTPGSASSLVTSGIYKVTRNPMYVGLLFFLIGWGVFLSNLFALASAACFVPYMNRFQIAPEEKALEALFGEEFQAYKEKVRRWV